MQIVDKYNLVLTDSSSSAAFCCAGVKRNSMLLSSRYPASRQQAVSRDDINRNDSKIENKKITRAKSVQEVLFRRSKVRKAGVDLRPSVSTMLVQMNN